MTSERDWVELAARGIQALAVLIMVVLIGLELMVAADIIETAAIELTLLNLAMLGALVIVRTVLGWTLTVEVEGHWPWQRGRRRAA